MKRALLLLLAFVLRQIFSLRYKIKVSGLKAVDEQIRGKKNGALFLPNHVALIDPILMSVWFWPKYKLRPLSVEYVYRLPVLGKMIQILRGVSIPNFDTSINQYKQKKAEVSFEKVREGLSHGDNFLIYPAGALKRQAKEVIGGASGVQELLQKCPEVEIILVRISGLYGSSFSRIISGMYPNIGQLFLMNFKALLKNGIFFTPRRKVYIELSPAPADFPREGTRTQINHYMEMWYNQYRDDQGHIHEEEPVKRISYSFWKEELLPIIEPKKKSSSTRSDEISPETRDSVYDEIRNILENKSLEIRPEMSLGQDLGMDSLNIAELMGFLLRKYAAKTHGVDELDTVQSVLEFAQGIRESQINQDGTNSLPFIAEQNRPAPFSPSGSTLPESFFYACKRMGNYIAMSDERAGNLTYSQCKKSVLVLAEYFKTFPEQNVAIMLPASAASFITIFALQLAGKVPVMLNWTLGPRYLEQMMQLSGAKRILSSWAFLEKLFFVDFGSASDQIQFLEDIKGAIPLKMKLKGLFYAIFDEPKITLSENDTAVILFTSGTEAMPKGVPLSHRNILSSCKAGYDNLCTTFSSGSVNYAFIPPFHSFGFNCAGISPIILGMRSYFSPDPTDSLALASGIEKWNITHMCIVPNFLKKLLDASKGNQLSSIRAVGIGGDRASPELYQYVEKMMPKAKLLEGYGVTECSPIISVQRPDLPPEGVGQLLPELEAMTINHETAAPLPEGSEGEICVSGPSVFNGYLGNVKSPFIQIDGKLWYRTGDIGRITPNRSVVLTGRLKRFIKLGGEMISLGAIENALQKELEKNNEIKPGSSSLAICVDDEDKEKARLILFSTVPINAEKANVILKTGGFSRLIKISATYEIREIPLMGTGKTNYRELQDLLAQFKKKQTS